MNLQAARKKYRYVKSTGQIILRESRTRPDLIGRSIGTLTKAGYVELKIEGKSVLPVLWRKRHRAGRMTGDAPRAIFAVRQCSTAAVWARTAWAVSIALCILLGGMPFWDEALWASQEQSRDPSLAEIPLVRCTHEVDVGNIPVNLQMTCERQITQPFGSWRPTNGARIEYQGCGDGISCVSHVHTVANSAEVILIDHRAWWNAFNLLGDNPRSLTFFQGFIQGMVGNAEYQRIDDCGNEQKRRPSDEPAGEPVNWQLFLEPPKSFLGRLLFFGATGLASVVAGFIFLFGPHRRPNLGAALYFIGLLWFAVATLALV